MQVLLFSILTFFFLSQHYIKTKTKLVKKKKKMFIYTNIILSSHFNFEKNFYLYLVINKNNED